MLKHHLLFTVCAFIVISFPTKSSVCLAAISILLLDDNINRPSSADKLNTKKNRFVDYVEFQLILYLKFLSELIEFVIKFGSSNLFFSKINS